LAPQVCKFFKDIIQLTVPMVIRRRHGHKLILALGESDETWLEIQDKEYGPSPLALHLSRAHVWNREKRQAFPNWPKT